MGSKKALLLSSKITTVVFSGVLGLVAWGNWLANENQSLVSSVMKEKIMEIIPLDGGEAIDPYSGVTNPNYNWFYKNKHNNIKELEAEADRLCEQVVAEGSALLYNKKGTYDGETKTALPIKKSSKVTMFSTGSVRPHLAGQGSHMAGNITNSNTYKDAFTKAGHQINETMWNRYMDMHGEGGSTSADKNNKYRRNRNSYAYEYKLGDIPWQDLYTNADTDVQNSVAEYGDAAIFCITRQGGEGVDMHPGRYGSKYPGQGDGVDMLKLNSNERSVLKGLTALKKEGKVKRIIVNLNTSNAVGMEFLNDEDIDVDAVIWTGGLGETGIYAVPKLLDGTYNFSGSMPFTIYYDNWDNPATANWFNGEESRNDYSQSNIFYTDLDTVLPTIPDAQRPQAGDETRTAYIVYQEGIYTDYRYPETRYEDVVTKRNNVGTFDYGKTIFATHGTGLSYTTFNTEIVNVNKSSDLKDFNIEVKVTNTGTVAGKKAVQLYGQKPYTTYDVTNHVEKSAVDFVGFGKTKLLAPNESETLTIHVNGRDFLASYDAYGAKTYIVDEGDYYLAVGNNAHDATNNILAKKGYGSAQGMDASGDASKTWTMKINKFDKTTFSTSRATGYPVTNLFDESDINLYSGRGDNHVDYITRNNWNGTTHFFGWDDVENKAINDYVVLKAVAQIFTDNFILQGTTDVQKTEGAPTFGRDYTKDPIVDSNGFTILDKNLTLVDLVDENKKPLPLNDERWDWLMDQITWDELATLVSKGQRHTEAIQSIGLPISFNYNESNGVAVGSFGDLNRSGIGGYVKEKALANGYNDPDKNEAAVLWPSNCSFTGTLNTELAYQCGAIWGEEANWGGMAGLYGPGFNCYRTAYGGRNYEYFGADSYGAGMVGAYLVKGIQDEGCFAVIKHFAFNDCESIRKSASLWTNEQAARENYLRMFEYPIVEGGALSVMGSMGRLGAVAANANKGLMTGWLKNETGLRGFATTDIQFYSNKEAMLKAGTDCFDNDSMSGENSLAAYKPEEGATTSYNEFINRMRDAGKRIAYTVLSSNAVNGLTANVKMIVHTPKWIKTFNIIVGTAGGLAGASVLFYAVAIYLNRKELF